MSLTKVINLFASLVAAGMFTSSTGAFANELQEESSSVKKDEKKMPVWNPTTTNLYDLSDAQFSINIGLEHRGFDQEDNLEYLPKPTLNKSSQFQFPLVSIVDNAINNSFMYLELADSFDHSVDFLFMNSGQYHADGVDLFNSRFGIGFERATNDFALGIRTGLTMRNADGRVRGDDGNLRLEHSFEESTKNPGLNTKLQARIQRDSKGILSSVEFNYLPQEVTYYVLENDQIRSFTYHLTVKAGPLFGGGNDDKVSLHPFLRFEYVQGRMDNELNDTGYRTSHTGLDLGFEINLAPERRVNVFVKAEYSLVDYNAHDTFALSDTDFNSTWNTDHKSGKVLLGVRFRFPSEEEMSLRE